MLAREARARVLTAARRTPEAASEGCTSDCRPSSGESVSPDSEACVPEDSAEEAASLGIESACSELGASLEGCDDAPSAGVSAELDALSGAGAESGFGDGSES